MNGIPLENYLLGIKRHASQQQIKGARFTSVFGTMELEAAQAWGITPDAYYRLPRDTRAMMTAKIWIDNFQAGVRAYERRKESERKGKRK